MDLLSNIGLSLPGFGALLFLPTKYPVANNGSIYMREFAVLSKRLSTSAGLGSGGSVSSRSEL